MNFNLDHNAGAPLRRQADAAMAEAVALLAAGGNPSAPHALGRALRERIEAARDAVATLAGTAAERVVFTSGATESANTVLAGSWQTIVHSGIEHDCVRRAAGPRSRAVPVAPDGMVDLAGLEAVLKEVPEDTLIVMAAACHETGVLQPVEAVHELAARFGASFFCDATQALGRQPGFAFDASGADHAGCSAAKVGGPPGVGALLLRPDARFSPLLRGGGQEGRRRAGSENLVGIVGFGAAAQAATGEDWEGVRALRDRLEAQLAAAVPGVRFHGRGVPRLPNTSCFAVPGWPAERLVIALDLEGFCVGAGAACSSGTPERSRTARMLAPDGDDPIRVSLGPDTPTVAIAGLVAAISALATRHLQRAA